MERRLTDVHMMVLACLRTGEAVHPDEIAVRLSLPSRVIDVLCADLEAAGLIDEQLPS